MKRLLAAVALALVATGCHHEACELHYEYTDEKLCVEDSFDKESCRDQDDDDIQLSASYYDQSCASLGYEWRCADVTDYDRYGYGEDTWMSSKKKCRQ